MTWQQLCVRAGLPPDTPCTPANRDEVRRRLRGGHGVVFKTEGEDVDWVHRTAERARGKDMAKNEVLEAVEEGMSKINKRINQTAEWVARVEAKVNTERSHGPGDGLLHAVPMEHRGLVDAYEARRVKDPVKKVCFDLVMQSEILGEIERVKRTGKSAGEWKKQRDDILTAMGYDPVLKAALGEDTASIGGNLIPVPVEAEIQRLISDNSLVAPIARHITMSAKTHQLPTENSGLTAFIVPEAATISDSAPASPFAQYPITARKYAGLATVSMELLQDNIVGLSDYLFTAVAEKIGRLQDEQVFHGDGTNVTGLDIATGVNSFTVSGTATSGGLAPGYGDLVKLAFLAQERATRAGAWFFTSPGGAKNIFGNVDSAGQPLFTFGQAGKSFEDKVAGFPSLISSIIRTTFTEMTSSTRIYYGPSEKVIFGDLRGMGLDTDPYGLFASAQVRIRVIQRVGIAIPVGKYFSIMKGVKYS